MKRIYIFILLTVVAHQLVNAQWTYVGSAFPGQVRGLYFESKDIGYAAGGNAINTGYIAKTIDGGSTWTIDTFTQSVLLRSFSFLNTDTGFACGSRGVLLKTTDAGNTWTLIYKDSTQYFRAIDFVSSQVGFMGGSLGTIWKTEDGGTSWTMYSLSESTSDVIQLSMVDVNTGYAVCSEGVTPFANGYVFKTTDGGATWSPVYYDPASGILGLAVVDAQSVYAGGVNQSIIKTTNGGIGWDTVYSGFPGVSIRGGFAVSNEKIFMVDDGFLINGGNVLSTFDAGSTWKDTSIGIGGLYSLYFPTEVVGFTGDSAGNVYRVKLPCETPAAPAAINGTTSICSGDSASFTISPVDNADSYQWQVPSDAVIISGQGDTVITVVFGSASGDISVTSISDTCASGITSLSITIIPSPQIPVITFASGILSSSASTGNQWYFNGIAIPAATDQTYMPTQNGTYTVIVTDGNGCSSMSAPFEVTTIGISEISVNSLITAYPNPFDSYTVLTLTQNTYMRNGRIVINDIAGRVMSTFDNINGNNIIILRGTLSAGIYFYSLFDMHNGLVGTGKLIAR